MNQTVLVVDDEDNIREMLSMLLEMFGYTVTKAQDGLDALDKIREVQPDLILLDVMMPNMDGISLCKLLRTQPETADLPVIILSGKTNFGAEAEGLAAGANVYMFKPMDTQKLLSTIRNVLESAHAMAV
jgi:DNA-binding response OmpR family regulator